jgi:replication factor C subunit 3/5
MPQLPFLTLYSDQVTEKTAIPPPDWEALISQIADEILAERSPARILQVRAKLYDLLTHCIPASTILKVIFLDLDSATYQCWFPQTLTFKLIPKIDDALKTEIIKWSAFYEHRIQMGAVSETYISNVFSQYWSSVETYLPSGSFRCQGHAHRGEVSDHGNPPVK